MQAAADRGWRAMVVHFRGCSGELNLLARAYHSGDSEEGDWILRRVHARWPDCRPARSRHLARRQHVGKVARRTRGGCAVRRGGGIDRFAARPGRRRRGARARLQPALHPHVSRNAQAEGAGQARRVSPASPMPIGCASAAICTTSTTNTRRRCTASATPRTTGRRASGKPWLGGVRVPHLVLNALNDPFVPAESLPRPHDVSRFVHLEQPSGGGHIGFASGPPPGRLDFLPQRLFEFFIRGV